MNDYEGQVLGQIKMPKITDSYPSASLQVGETGLLKVTISNEPGAIPLKDLTKTLEDYLNQHGGQGNLRIQIFYKDDEGMYREWKP